MTIIYMRMTQARPNEENVPLSVSLVAPVSFAALKSILERQHSQLAIAKM
jgi:hypothetical protein